MSTTCINNQTFVLTQQKCKSCSLLFSNCQQCSTAYCQLCQDRYFISPGALCLTCPFDCLTCDGKQNCLSCSPQDFRILEGNRCIPMNGFYESSTRVGASCPQFCQICTTPTDCSACIQDYALEGATCVAKSVSGWFWVGLAIQIILLSILIGVILCVLCGKNQDEDQTLGDEMVVEEERGNSVAPPGASLSVGSASAIVRQSNVTPDRSPRWIDRDITSQVSGKSSNCLLCLSPNPYFLTSCGHYFHTSCISQWKNERRSTCPQCKNNLQKTSHTIFCSQCAKKTSKVRINDIINLEQSKAKSMGTCGSCKARQFD